MTEKTSTEKLVAALEVEANQNPAVRPLIGAAQDFEYHDYKSPHIFPIAQLVHDLKAVGASKELIERTKNGEFDGTKAEAKEYMESEEGQETYEAFKKFLDQG